MGIQQGLISSYGGASVPPIPSLTNCVGLFSSFGIAAGWQNGSSIFDGVNTGPLASTAVAPWPLDWAGVDSGDDFIDAWNDQSGNANNAINPGVPPHAITSSERFTYNGTDQFMEIPSTVFSSVTDKLTVYQLFSSDNLALLQSLLASQYTTDYLTNGANVFANYITVAGNIVASQKTDDVVDLFNSKTVALPNTGLHLMTTVFDRAVAGAGATVLKLDNSTAGVSNVQTDTMTGNFSGSGGDVIGIGNGQPLGAPVFLDGTCNELWMFSDVDSGRDTDVWNYLSYLYNL